MTKDAKSCFTGLSSSVSAWKDREIKYNIVVLPLTLGVVTLGSYTLQLESTKEWQELSVHKHMRIQEVVGKVVINSAFKKVEGRGREENSK